MSPRKIGPRCGNLLCLVWSGTSIDEISDFLDQDQELREYFQSNGTFDEKDVLVTECNYPPMHWAAIMGRVDILTLFLEEYDFFPDAREIDKTHSMTPLHWAIMHQHPDCVRVLLKHGSNPNLGGKWRGKRFDSAHSIRRKTNTDICKMLQEVARGQCEAFFPIIKFGA